MPKVESDEYVQVTNQGTAAQDMTGWWIKDAGDPGQDFYFPGGFVLAPGQSCRVYTNEDHPEYCNGFAMSFHSGTAIWNNDGDCGYLFNHESQEVSRRCY